jgi:hypothetical protein
LGRLDDSQESLQGQRDWDTAAAAATSPKTQGSMERSSFMAAILGPGRAGRGNMAFPQCGHALHYKPIILVDCWHAPDE